MRTLLTLLFTILLAASSFADRAVLVYAGSTGTGRKVSRGATYVLFDLVGFTGSIGNASFSNQTLLLPVPGLQDGTTLGEIPYLVTSGTLVIVEER